MTSFMRFRGSLLVGTVCVLSLAAGSAQADPVAAQRLFLEATTLSAQARNETDLVKRAQLLERAQRDIQAITTLHGDSVLAARLGRGETIGSFDPRAFERDLSSAQAAAGTAVPTQASAAMTKAPPLPPMATPAPEGPKAGPADTPRRLPTVAIDPKTPAGKVLADVVGALDAAMEGDPSTTLTVAKPITATESGETVTLTFPGLSLVVDGGSTLALGDLRLDVTPQPDNRYAFTLPLPAEIIGATKGQPEERVTLAAEPITGVWAPSAGSLLRLYVRVRDLKVEQLAPEPRMMLSVSGISMEQKGDLQGNRLSGDFSLDVRDVLANDTSSTQQVHIGHLGLSTQALDFDLESWRRFSQAMQSNGDASAAAFDFLSRGSWAKLGTNIALDDFQMTEEGKPTGSLGGLHLGLDFDARPQAGVTMTVKLGMDRLKATQIPVGDLPPGMVPHSFTINASLEPIPLQAIAATLQEPPAAAPPKSEDEPVDEAETDAESDAMPAATGASAENKMLGIMMAAQPTLKVSLASLASELVQMSLTGAMTVDAESPTMSRGAVTLKIAGLDQVKSYLDTQSKTDQSLKSYIPMVVVLRGLGSDTQLGSGKAKEYKIIAAKDGNVTINGTPWQALMMSGNEEETVNTVKTKDKDKKRSY